MKKYSKGASLILVKGSKALLMLRDDNENISYPGCWALNGGSVEEGETYKEAAKRELKEETGYDSENPKLLETVEYVNDNGLSIKAKRYYDIFDGSQDIKCLEGQSIKFFTIKKIKKLKVFPGHGNSAIKAIKVANQQD